MLPALALAKINWRRVCGLGACAGIVVLLLYVRLQSIALEQARLVYQHPRQIARARVVVIRGPVRIVTRVIKEPGGREETVREETHAAVTETTDSVVISEPVPMPTPRASRWLAGVAFEPFHYHERGSMTALAGYSAMNRVDVCAGVTTSGRLEALVLVRF